MKQYFPAMLATTMWLSAPAVTLANAPLRICADPGNMPLSNNRQEGFENKIAQVIAQAMGTQATFFYRPYLERGLTRQTFKNNSCDILMDMTVDTERMIKTQPVYRSTFVLASRADRNLEIRDLDDPQLQQLSIGVFQHSAMRTELLEHGVNGTNVKLQIISHDADLKPEHQPVQIVKDVLNGQLDLAAVWGPYAGYFNSKQAGLGQPLKIIYLNQWNTTLPMEFSMYVGLKKRDKDLRDKVNTALKKAAGQIKQILMDYGVPLVECPDCIVSGSLPSHGPYKKLQFIDAKYEPAKQSDPKQLPDLIDQALNGGSTLEAELVNAVLARDLTRVDYLLKHGADINTRDTSGLTPLMLAVKTGDYYLVRKLLKQGADYDLTDRDGWTAVMHAAWNNEPKMIRVMGAGYGANLEKREKLTLNTALGLATLNGKALAAVALLDSGAKPDTRIGDAGYTPLMIAVEKGNKTLAQILIQYGANVDAKNDGGVTPLMISVAQNKPKLVALLLKSKADPDIKNDLGETALDLAKKSGSKTLIQLIQSYSKS